MAKKGEGASRIGEVGVHRVIAELITRGFVPFRPVVDDHGVDLMLANGVRIQVKTSSLHRNRNTRDRNKMLDSRRYSFGLFKMIWPSRDLPRRASLRNLVNECDFVIFVGLDENRFWIVPAEKLVGCTGLKIPERGQNWKARVDSRYTCVVHDGEDAWEALSGERPQPAQSEDSSKLEPPVVEVNTVGKILQ